MLAFLLAAILFAASLWVRTQSTPPGTATPALLSSTETPIPVVETAAPVVVSATDSPPDNAPSGGIVTFREGLVGGLQRLNPLIAALNPVDQDMTSLIFEGLTRANLYGEPEPALARAWVVSSDGLEYVFTLRDDIRWQDGVPFTSLDVAYTMSLLRAPDYPGPANVREFWRTVETEILGEHLVRFRLTQPLGTFLDQLQIGILPEHALRGTGAAQLAAHPFNLTPIGTGPYQLERIAIDPSGVPTQIDLRVAPIYRQRISADDTYQIDRLSFVLFADFDAALRALGNGEIDGLAARTQVERQRLADLANSGAPVDLHTQIAPVLGAIIFNWQREETRFFREQRVRVALQIGLDRSSVIERNLVNMAVEASSPLLPSSWAYLPDLPWPAFDPVAARAQLDAVNLRLEGADDATPVPEGEATPPASTALFAFRLLVPDEPALVQLAQEIAAQWSQLNLAVTVEAVNLETYRTRLQTGDFDAALVEYALIGSADPDVYNFWHQGQFVPDGDNYGGADDRRISELLEAARRDPNGINRIESYREFQREFVERAIAIPLYYPLFTYATGRDFAGIQLGALGKPADRLAGLAGWHAR